MKVRKLSVSRIIAMPAMLLLLVITSSPLLAVDFGAEKFKAGDRAPDFTLPDLNGNQVSLSSFAGKKVVFLAFFGLRCGTCLMEAPYLEKIHRKYGGEEMVMLAVSTDGVDAKITGQTMKEVGFDVTYDILVDTEFTATDTYTNFIVPLSLVIDKEGVIRYIHTGFEEGTEKKYEKAVKKALGF